MDDGGIKINSFRGTAPKVSPELLPSLNGQIARNCKLFSGDLKPFPEPVVFANHGRTGVIETLYALRDPITQDPVFLSWPDEVNVATPSFSTSGDQRFYYSGDGVPKVSNYTLALEGAAPYPTDYYELGIPLPEDEIVATAAAFTTKSVTTFSRSSAAEATIVTSAAHGLRTGSVVAISGFSYRAGTYDQVASTTITVTLINHGLTTGGVVDLDFTSGTASDGSFVVTVTGVNTFTIVAPTSTTTSGIVNMDLTSFNTISADVTVTDDTTFSYYSPGPAIAATASSAGSVDLANTTNQRFYVFTWYTPWEEESIGSEPSEPILVKEGQVVTVTGLPSTNPVSPESGLTTTNFIRGVRLYRTFVGAEGSAYFLLKTLWFPTATATIARTSNIATVSLEYPHNMIKNERFKLTGVSDASFNVSDGVVLTVVDEYTFTYASAATDLAETANTTGTLYHDISQKNSDDPRYWGYANYNFIDDFDPTLLIDTLGSNEYSVPPEDLKGLKVMNSDTLVGFVGNRLYFSEPGKPHAWPQEYEITLEHDIVGVEPVSSVGIVVLTVAYPYLIQGSDPGSMTPQRIDALFPCVSSRSIVPMSYGIAYASHEGLAVFSAGSGAKIATASLHDADTWAEALVPSSIVATYYGDQYFGSHMTGSIIFEQDQQGGYIVDCDETFTATWYDTLNNRLFYAKGLVGDVYEWDDATQPMQVQEWKSKVIVTKDYLNIGAARVIADYGTTSPTWDAVTTNWEDTDILWNAFEPLTFKLWVDKVLVYENTVFSGAIFRLPTGYRGDTFEVSVSGNMRVRAIHLGQTPLSLKGV